jgi:hypothetical protein
MIEIERRLAAGERHVTHGAVTVSLLARTPPDWRAVEAKRAAALYGTERVEVMVLRTKDGTDLGVVRAAVNGDLPPGVYACGALQRALNSKRKAESARPDVAKKQRLHAAVRAARALDAKLPPFSANLGALVDSVEAVVARQQRHLADDSFARLLRVDHLRGVLDCLVQREKRLAPLARLACVCKLWAAAVRKWVRPDVRARGQVRCAVYTLFPLHDPSKTALLRVCPALKEHLDALVSRPFVHSQHKIKCLAFPRAELVESLLQLWSADHTLDLLRGALAKMPPRPADSERTDAIVDANSRRFGARAWRSRR